MAEQPGPARRLAAVFVLDTAAVTGPMLAGWLAAGHRIAAIVVPPLKRQGRRSGSGVLRRRLERRRFVRRYLGGREVPLLEFGPPYDWSAMAPQLTGLKADVLICFAFPRLIPEFVLGCFPNGGLNIHPALLPHYRGPNPVHCLVIDAAMAQHGGVTLHRMTPRFDDGDIIAQFGFAEPAWRSMPDFLDTLAAGLERLVVRAAPHQCAGALKARPQPTGAFHWARLGSAPLAIPPNATAQRVAQLWSFVGRAPGLCVMLDGRPVRLGQRLLRLGPPTGEAPKMRFGVVTFDLADGRFAHLVYGTASKRLERLRRRLHRLRPAPAALMEVPSGPDEPPQT